MKHRTRIGLFLSVMLIILIGGWTQIKAKPGPTLENRIVFKAKISKDLLARTAKLFVYPIETVKADQDMFDMHVNQLFPAGVKGRQVQTNGVITLADTDNASNFIMLELGTAYMSFNRGMAHEIDDKPGNLPEEEKAIELAKEFLKQNKLSPDNSNEMFPAHVGHIRSASFDPKTYQRGPVRDQMLTVYFARRLDDVPVMGACSTVIVRIGDEGKIVGGARRWAEHGKGRAIKEDDLRSIEQLTKDIETFLNEELNTAKYIEIVQFILTYYDNGGNFIQPVLAYEAKVIGSDLEYAYLGQTALLKIPPERVGPEPLTEEAKRFLKKSSPDERRIPADTND